MNFSKQLIVEPFYNTNHLALPDKCVSVVHTFVFKLVFKITKQTHAHTYTQYMKVCVQVWLKENQLKNVTGAFFSELWYLRHWRNWIYCGSPSLFYLKHLGIYLKIHVHICISINSYYTLAATAQHHRGNNKKASEYNKREEIAREHELTVAGHTTRDNEWASESKRERSNQAAATQKQQ